MRQALTNHLRRNEGAVALEFAIVGSLFIFLSLAIIDFGRNFHNQHKMAHIADQLARAIYLNPTMSRENILLKFAEVGGSDFSLIVEDTSRNGVPTRSVTVYTDQDYISPALSDFRGRISIVRSVPIYRPYP